MAGMNMQQMMKQARKMQEQLAAAQEGHVDLAAASARCAEDVFHHVRCEDVVRFVCVIRGY